MSGACLTETVVADRCPCTAPELCRCTGRGDPADPGQGIIELFVLAKGALPRGAISAMLASQADIRVLGEAGDPASARPVPGLRRPDVLLVFLDSAEREEIAVLDGVRRTFGRRPVLLVIRSLSPGGARRALAADPAGVVTEDASPQTLIEAIKHVKNGRRAVAPDVALLASASTPSPFTPRETEILALAAEGEGPAETARRLHLSAGTVRNHLLSAVQKTGARNRLDAIRIARRKGWL